MLYIDRYKNVNILIYNSISLLQQLKLQNYKKTTCWMRNKDDFSIKIDVRSGIILLQSLKAIPKGPVGDFP